MVLRKLMSTFVAAVFACALVGCAGNSTESDGYYTSLDQFDNATIGVLSGSSYDLVTQELFPDAERVYYTQVADLLISLEQGKIDGFMVDEVATVSMVWEGADIATLIDTSKVNETAFAFCKDGSRDYLVAQVNEFVDRAWEDGTIAYLEEKWVAPVEPTEHPDYKSLPGENGTLKVAVDPTIKPMVYLKEGSYTGYEIELLTLFAEEYGYALEIDGMSFESLLPSVVSGKYDLAGCDLTVTPERSESVTFSNNHFDARRSMVVMTSGEGASVEQVEDMLPSDFNREGVKIGVLTGSSHDLRVGNMLPLAERVYYTQMADVILAVSQGKIDCFVEDRHFTVAALWDTDGVRCLETPLDQAPVAFAFPQGERSAQLREEMNAFIAKALEGGTITGLQDKWFGDSEPTEFVDYTNLPGENGSIRIAVSIDNKPMIYLKNGGFAGFEIELLTLFAQEYGYSLDFQEMTFDAVLGSLATGRCDMGASGINITPEREESISFSDPYMLADAAVVVANSGSSGSGNFLTAFVEDVKVGFEKTFVREDRWKLIVSGIGVTLLISLCSIIGGSLLGFGLYMMCRSQNRTLSRVAGLFAKVHSRIIAGTPAVVVLMILYYVVFGSMEDISGVLVAIVGFSLTFAAFVYDHLLVSVESVGRGQNEAAQAFGYTPQKGFFKIILPQAMGVFMPSYCSEAVSLIKATAIVGYIAVSDLTRVGDIIRSNTYEAFFPLIAVAIVYFMLTWGASALLKVAARRLDPKQRSAEQILKGIDIR